MQKVKLIPAILFVFSLALIQSLYSEQTGYDLPFKKVILWGHKLHTNTFSYINAGFYRAFQHLGYDIYWFDNNDDLRNFDFSNSLFITEGQVDQKIPLRKDCFYILHNCDGNKYTQLTSLGHTIILQVYTHDCIERNVTWIDDCMCYDMAAGVIYLPWATDLLPHEIEQNKQKTRTAKRKNEIVYIGAFGDGIRIFGDRIYGNIDQITPFLKAAAENNISFNHVRECSCSMETNIDLVQSAYMAPAIQGQWQVKKGYIPCRIFKNISYGAFGITNSKTVYDLFHGKIIYNPDEYQLFYDAKEKIDNLNLNELYELMDFVKEKHTYINRIHDMLWFFEKVYESKK